MIDESKYEFFRKVMESYLAGTDFTLVIEAFTDSVLTGRPVMLRVYWEGDEIRMVKAE